MSSPNTTNSSRRVNSDVGSPHINQTVEQEPELLVIQASSVFQAKDDLMCRKTISTVVAILAANLICNPLVRSQSRNLSNDEVRAQISKLGTGPKALVRVTLKDKRKMQGWLSLVTDDHFSLTDEKSGSVNEIKYADVAGIKNLKPSKGAVITGTVAGLSLAVVIFLFAGAKH